MSLGLVIPVWNDQSAMTKLLGQVQSMVLFEQVVLVDDGSDTPVEVPEWVNFPIVLIRNDRPLGPGSARNLGLEAVTTRHVLFFDSDDLLTAELGALWQDLQEQVFDFCLFRHCDSRQALRGNWGMMGHDAMLWREAGMGGRALEPVKDQARNALARTANYPWNKIWRTDALHIHEIRYSNTMVHEDIEPHWMGFLRAGHILASDRIAAIHHVSPNSTRLTNLRNSERLKVFGPMGRVLNRLKGAGADRAGFLHAFLNFSADLFDWIHGNLDTDFHVEFSARRRAFWLEAVEPALFERLAFDDPDLALRLSLQMAPDGKLARC